MSVQDQNFKKQHLKSTGRAKIIVECLNITFEMIYLFTLEKEFRS